MKYQEIAIWRAFLPKAIFFSPHPRIPTHTYPQAHQGSLASKKTPSREPRPRRWSRVAAGSPLYFRPVVASALSDHGGKPN
jgi:hypothetical protein